MFARALSFPREQAHADAQREPVEQALNTSVSVHTPSFSCLDSIDENSATDVAIGSTLSQ
jgi:hypothetical protein